jgi:hypothetical protein
VTRSREAAVCVGGKDIVIEVVCIVSIPPCNDSSFAYLAVERSWSGGGCERVRRRRQAEMRVSQSDIGVNRQRRLYNSGVVSVVEDECRFASRLAGGKTDTGRSYLLQPVSDERVECLARGNVRPDGRI